jgi:hypothetical protein
VSNASEHFAPMQIADAPLQPCSTATPIERLHASLLCCLAEARFAGVKLIVYLLEMAIMEIESRPRGKPAY